eukprot:gene41167-50956_t
MVLTVTEANAKAMEKNEKQISIGISKDDITPLVRRMLDLLVEAGLIYEQKEVKHGSPERVYARYVPHTAMLIEKRAFSKQGGYMSAVESYIRAIIRGLINIDRYRMSERYYQKLC